ncbi:MAG: DUF4154 domain-containing protein [Cyclobacteriaceae bacterium]
MLCLVARVAIGQVSYPELKSVLIPQLANQIEWPDNVLGAEFSIGFYGRDSLTYEIMQSKPLTVHGKEVKVSWVDPSSIDAKLDLLYVDQSECDQIAIIAQQLENTMTLLITEECRDSRYIMLNLVRDEASGSVSFEINKANIIIENLGIADELLLLGGNQVDIRELFREMKIEMKNQQQVMTELEQTKIQFEKASRTHRIETQRFAKAIDSLTRNSRILENEIAQNQSTLSNLTNEIYSRDSAIAKQDQIITQQNQEVEDHHRLLDQQDTLIQARNRELERLSETRSLLQFEINEIVGDLDAKEALITSQKRAIYLFVMFVLLLLGSGIAAYIAFKKRKLLYDRLEDLNQELLEANEELNTSNESLEVQKTELSNLLSKLEATQVKLLQADKLASLGTLTAGVAHEINNPLNFINSGNELLKLITEKKDDEVIITEADTYEMVMENIGLGIRRINAIVKSLNAFSRTGSGEFEDCFLHEIIDSCLTILEHEYKDRIEVKRKYAEGELVVKGVDSQLYQVFTNLISNAIHAILETGDISIETAVEDKWVTIRIEDTGHGIEEENMKKIFDPFYTTKDPGKGTGLGLSIVYRIIEEHGGKINFSSKKHEGTQVTLNLLQK